MRLTIPLLMLALAGGAESPNRQWEEQYDKLKIRHSPRMVTDTSPEFLKVPAYAYPPDHPGFDVAKTPPVIDFAVVQVSPEYLENGTYGGWGENRLGPDGKYYFSIGNHKGYGGADAFIIAYDPAAKTHETVLSSMQVCGWGPQDFGDGKLHGEPDIAPNGDMWLLTFYGPYPKLADWGKTYQGGHLIRFNIFTRKAEYLGRPVKDDSWPIHNWDWKRQRLYAIGEWGVVLGAGRDQREGYGDWDYGKLLVYDTQRRQVIHAEAPVVTGSNPPDRIRWWRRSLLLDRATGRVYGNECSPPYGFAGYDPDKKRFFRMKSALEAPLLSYTERKSKEGIFWLFDRAGNFYKFWPDRDRVELIGKNWRDGEYIENLRLSPRERYLYYIAASGQNSPSYGMPVIQYDIRSGRKKVLAFLCDYYLDKYGYGTSNTYGLSLSANGDSIFTHVNGRFAPDRKRIGYGRSSIFHIHIPAAERQE